MERRSFLARAMAGAVTAIAAPLAWSREHCDQPVVRYPDPAVEILDSRFEKYRQDNAAVERLWTGAWWAEGPVWFGESRKLANGRLFCDMGQGGSDGIRCDVDGNVWAAAGWGGDGYDGVHILAPDGKLIGKIRLPETCANLCFGGAKHNRLFMAASQSLYALYVNTQGAQMP